jgi:hypothetical protein
MSRKKALCVWRGFPCPISTRIRMFASVTKNFSSRPSFRQFNGHPVPTQHCPHSRVMQGYVEKVRDGTRIGRGGEAYSKYDRCIVLMCLVYLSHHRILPYLFLLSVFSWNEWISVSEGMMKHVLSHLHAFSCL